jgi:hypothetical protein
MAMNFERLLKLTADFHNFCNDDFAVSGTETPDDELSLDELDFVAAAAQIPVKDEDLQKK